MKSDAVNAKTAFHFSNLVEHPLAGMSNQLFVSRYHVQLPGKAEIAAFFYKAVEELVGGNE
ncbi:hypothetical protein B0B52_01780 [Polaromonas sp. A23]|nr:hypothetical protein B0B52_01780 [Polaromonas sp. A23]